VLKDILHHAGRKFLQIAKNDSPKNMQRNYKRVPSALGIELLKVKVWMYIEHL
jgi:hypothetical protein